MDYLRLLWARIGIPHCPECGVEVARRTVQEIVDDIIWHYEGHGIFVWSPVIRDRKGTHADLFSSIGRARDISMVASMVVRLNSKTHRP